MGTTRALEVREIQSLFAEVSGRHAVRNRAMLTLGIAAALRATELVSLTVGDVHDGGQVRTYVKIRGETAKLGKPRTIRLGEGIRQVMAHFIEWKRAQCESLKPDAPLFRSQKGGPLTRIALLQTVTRILNAARINESPHSLRKTGATIYYIASSYDIIATQHFLGHADPATTRKYIGLTTEQLVNYSEQASEKLLEAIADGASDGKFSSSVTVSYLSFQRPTFSL